MGPSARDTRPRAPHLADARRTSARMTAMSSSTARESDRLLGATEETLASSSGTQHARERATKEGYSLRALTVGVFMATCAVCVAFAKELSGLSTLDDAMDDVGGEFESVVGEAATALGRTWRGAWA